MRTTMDQPGVGNGNTILTGVCIMLYTISHMNIPGVLSVITGCLAGLAALSTIVVNIEKHNEMKRGKKAPPWKNKTKNNDSIPLP